MHTILDLTEKTSAKVIFLRDLNAKSSFTAGNSIQTLKQAGIEIFRFNNFTKTLTPDHLYTPNLISIKDDNERTKQLASLYTQKEDKERDNTVVIVGTKEQVRITNNAIHE